MIEDLEKLLHKLEQHHCQYAPSTHRDPMGLSVKHAEPFAHLFPRPEDSFAEQDASSLEDSWLLLTIKTF